MHAHILLANAFAVALAVFALDALLLGPGVAALVNAGGNVAGQHRIRPAAPARRRGDQIEICPFRQVGPRQQPLDRIAQLRPVRPRETADRQRAGACRVRVVGREPPVHRDAFGVRGSRAGKSRDYRSERRDCARNGLGKRHSPPPLSFRSRSDFACTDTPGQACTRGGHDGLHPRPPGVSSRATHGGREIRSPFFAWGTPSDPKRKRIAWRLPARISAAASRQA